MVKRGVVVAISVTLFALAGCRKEAPKPVVAAPITPERPMVDAAAVRANELGRIPVVMYHDVNDKVGKNTKMNRTKASFEKDLQLLHDKGFYPVTLRSVVDGTMDVPAGKSPVVWEVDADRRTGAIGYEVIDPKADQKRYYKTIVDVSGDASLLDTLISCLAPGGEIVLAGFYDAPMTFSFPQAFMREARIRVAAQWQPKDLLAVKNLAESDRLSLDGLITHHASPHQADQAYRQAFSDKDCLKMVLDWRTLQ